MDLVASSHHYLLLLGDELFFPLKRRALRIKKKKLSEFEGGDGGTSPNEPVDRPLLFTLTGKLGVRAASIASPRPIHPH